MAAAKVSYHVGREGKGVYGEEWNDTQTGILHHKHHFQMNVDPYKILGNPASGLLPKIFPAAPGLREESDKRTSLLF